MVLHQYVRGTPGSPEKQKIRIPLQCVSKEIQLALEIAGSTPIKIKKFWTSCDTVLLPVGGSVFFDDAVKQKRNVSMQRNDES